MGRFDDNPMRMDIEEAALLAGLDFLINVLVNEKNETCAVFAGALKPTYAAAVQKAKAHYLTPVVPGKDIVIANACAKSNEAFLALNIAYRSVNRQGGDVVLLANAPEGRVTHYLLGAFGTAPPGSDRSGQQLPGHVKRLIVFTEYPDIAAHGWFPDGSVQYAHEWEDVIRVLEQNHPGEANVAIYPIADIQYCQ